MLFKESTETVVWVPSPIWGQWVRQECRWGRVPVVTCMCACCRAHFWWKGLGVRLVPQGLGTVRKTKGTGDNLISNVVKYYKRKNWQVQLRKRGGESILPHNYFQAKFLCCKKCFLTPIDPFWRKFVFQNCKLWHKFANGFPALDSLTQRTQSISTNSVSSWCTWRDAYHNTRR